MPELRFMNKTILKGVVGKDPVKRLMPSGAPVCHFSVMTRVGNRVEWHSVVAYDEFAELAAAEFRGRDFVYVECEIRTREFRTADDKAKGRKPRKVLELVASELALLAKRAGGDADMEAGTPAEEPAANADAENDGDTGPAASFIGFL